MGRRKLPKNCRDWHEDLIRCTEARYNRRASLAKRDYAQWMKARDLLRASQDHIFVQPTGENKDCVIGIPKQIGPAISQYLTMVVRGEKPIIDPEDEAFMNSAVNVVDRHGNQLNAAGQNNPYNEVGFENGPWMDRRNYRDSAYAVMAAMYSLLRPDPHHSVKTAQVESEMRHYTDHEVRFDYRVRRQGAFKAMDQLVEVGLVKKQKGMGFGGGNFYSLTQRGLKVCYQLFHVKFTPTVNAAYTLVRPRGGSCEATAQGQIRMLGGGNAAANPLLHAQPRGLPSPRRPVMNFPGQRMPVGLPPHRGGAFLQDLGLHGDEDDEYEDYGMGGYDEPASPAPTPGSTRKRPLADAYHGDYDDLRGGAVEPVDLDYMRYKRLKHFQDLSQSSSAGSSSARKPAPAPASSSKDRGGSSAMKPVLLDAPAEGGDSQDAELEAVRMQTLLDYSEQESRRADARRLEAQALEDMQLEMAMDVSKADAAVEVVDLLESDYDYDFVPDPAAASESEWEDHQDLLEDAPGDGEGVGESQGEDFRRAVAMSLELTGQRTVPKPQAASSSSSSSAAAVAKARPASRSTTPSQSAPSHAATSSSREVIDLDAPVQRAIRGVDNTSVKRATPLANPPRSAPAQDRDVIALDGCSQPADGGYRSQSSVPSSPARSQQGQASQRKSQTTPVRSQTLPVVLEVSSGDTPPTPARARSAARTVPSAGRTVLGARDVISLDDSQSQSHSEQMLGEFRDESVICLDDSQDLNGYHLSPIRAATSSSRTRAGTSSTPSAVAVMLAEHERLRREAAQQDGPAPSSSRGKAVSTVLLLPVVSLQPLLTGITINLSHLHAPLVPVQEVPRAARDELMLIVDTRERFVQNRYRQFYFDVRSKCTAHLPPPTANMRLRWHTEQEELKLGDAATAFEASSSTGCASSQSQHDAEGIYLAGTIIERKALSDLISSSAGDARTRCGTARHVTQEMRLRHCELPHPFVLLEGHVNAANLHAKPLVWHDRDLSHPDVIDSAEGIVSYMCAVVARNYAPEVTVRVLQTPNNGATALLYTALTAVELYVNTLPQQPSRRCPTKAAFDKYCNSFGADKRGREASLRKDLVLGAPGEGGSGPVSLEMAARIVRRFGCWEALLNAYKLCYSASLRAGESRARHEQSRARQEHRAVACTPTQAMAAEVRCALLLCELTVGGTLLDREDLTASPGHAYDSDPDLPGSESDADLKQDSLRVWAVARQRLLAEGFITTSAANPGLALTALGAALAQLQPRRVTHLQLSQSMALGYLSRHASLDADTFHVQLESPPAEDSSSGSSRDASCGASARLGKGGKISAASKIGGFSSIASQLDGKYPHLHMYSADGSVYQYDAQVFARRSQGTCVAVISGHDLVDALVEATGRYKRQHGGTASSRAGLFADPSRSIPIVRGALHALRPRLPAEFGTLQSAEGVPVQCVLVVEAFTHPTSSVAGAMGRLSRLVNTGGTGRDADGAACVSFGEGYPEHALEDARDVSANEAWLTQLVVACASIFGGTAEGEEGVRGGGWQCFLAPNGEQTERILYALVHESQRQSLLLY